MTDLTEAMKIDPTARTGPLDVDQVLPDVSPELGPNIPEVVEQIDPNREERLIKEQQERTRLRNLGIMSEPTELKYKLPKSGVEKTLMADVDMRHAFTPKDDVQNFDTSFTAKNGTALFAVNFPRRQDGSVGNEDGSSFTLNQFIVNNVLPFVSAQLGDANIGAIAASSDQAKRSMRGIITKNTYDILRNNRNALEYFRENDPQGIAGLEKTMMELNTVLGVNEYGKEFKAGDEAEVLRRTTDPEFAPESGRFLSLDFTLPKVIGGLKTVTLDDPFNQEMVDLAKKTDESITNAKRGINWHMAYAGALFTELATSVTGIYEKKDGKPLGRFITPRESRNRTVTDFFEDGIGKSLGFTPKGVGELANTLVKYIPLSMTIGGYKKFTEEELNNPNLKVSDITGASSESVSDLIMYSIAKTTPSFFGFSPEDIANLDKVTKEIGMEADVTIPGARPRIDEVTGQVAFEGKPLGATLTDIFGGASALFGINAVSTGMLRRSGKDFVARTDDDAFNIMQNGKINREQLTRAFNAVDEGKDVAGLGALNLRVPLTSKRFLKESIIRSTNHPMRTAAGIQLFYAMSIGAAEGAQQLITDENGKFVSPLGGELSNAGAVGFTLFSAVMAPILALPLGRGIIKYGYDKTIAEKVSMFSSPEFFEVMKAVKNRSGASFRQAKKIDKIIRNELINLRDEFPEQFDQIYKSLDEVNKGNALYLENGRKAGIPEAELQQDIKNIKEITDHATTYLFMASARSFYDTKTTMNVIKGSLNRKSMERLGNQAREAAVVEANANNAQSTLTNLLIRQIRRLEDRQTKTAGIEDKAGLDRAMLKQQEQLAKMLRDNIGGVNPDELIPAMKALFNTADDLANGVVDTAEATRVVKNAIGGLTDEVDKNIFISNIFMANETGTIKGFEKIIDEALPNLRKAIDERDTSIKTFSGLVANNVTFEGTGTPIRPANKATAQHKIIMKAHKAAKEKSNALYNEVYKKIGGEQELYPVQKLRDILETQATALDYGPAAASRLKTILRKSLKPLDVEAKKLGLEAPRDSVTFKEAHQLRSDLASALFKEYRTANPDGAYINLLGETIDTINDSMEAFLERPQNVDIKNAFKTAQKNYKDNVAGLFYNSRVLRTTKEEKFSNLFTKIFNATSMDGQRDAFDKMFPEGSANRKQAENLLREEMLRVVMGNESNMSQQKFENTLRKKVRNAEVGMFGTKAEGGFLDILLGSEKNAKDYKTLDTLLPEVKNSGAVDTAAPMVKINQESRSELSKLKFYNEKELALEEGSKLNESLDSAVKQINVRNLDSVDEINVGYWKALAGTDEKSGFTQTTLDHILGSGRTNDGSQAADRYVSLIKDMENLVGVDDADTFTELLNRALLFDVFNQNIKRTKALGEVQPEGHKFILRENAEARRQIWIQHEQLWNTAFGKHARSIAHGIDMTVLAEQPARSVLTFAETVNKLSANGLLSRAWGAARGVVSLRYIGSEILLRNMLNDKSDILMRVLSTPELSPYIMDAVRYGQTPARMQNYFKTQFMAAMIAQKDDQSDIDDIQKHMNGFFKEAVRQKQDPVQLIMSMYFTSKNPELRKQLQIDLQRANQGLPSKLPTIMRESVSTPRGVKERLRPRAEDSPFLDKTQEVLDKTQEQLKNLGLL